MKGLEVWYLVKKYLEKEHHKIVKENIPLKTVKGIPLDIIEKELKVIDAIQNKGITILIKESEYLNNEHISMQVYKKHFSKEEYGLLKEVLL